VAPLERVRTQEKACQGDRAGRRTTAVCALIGHADAAGAASGWPGAGAVSESLIVAARRWWAPTRRTVGLGATLELFPLGLKRLNGAVVRRVSAVTPRGGALLQPASRLSDCRCADSCRACASVEF